MDGNLLILTWEKKRIFWLRQYHVNRDLTQIGWSYSHYVLWIIHNRQQDKNFAAFCRIWQLLAVWWRMPWVKSKLRWRQVWKTHTHGMRGRLRQSLTFWGIWIQWWLWMAANMVMKIYLSRCINEWRRRNTYTFLNKLEDSEEELLCCKCSMLLQFLYKEMCDNYKCVCSKECDVDMLLDDNSTMFSTISIGIWIYSNSLWGNHVNTIVQLLSFSE